MSLPKLHEGFKKPEEFLGVQKSPGESTFFQRSLEVSRGALGSQGEALGSFCRLHEGGAERAECVIWGLERF